MICGFRKTDKPQKKDRNAPCCCFISGGHSVRPKEVTPSVVSNGNSDENLK